MINSKKHIPIIIFCFFFILAKVFSQNLLIPMDEVKQKNHLKAYGVAYWVLEQDKEVDWLLNYRGGSFLAKYEQKIEKECLLRGVSLVFDGFLFSFSLFFLTCSFCIAFLRSGFLALSCRMEISITSSFPINQKLSWRCGYHRN